MKALLLDGSLKTNLDIKKIHSSIVEELERKGFETEALILRDINVAACQGCFECWVKTPGECKTDDYSREVAKKMVQSDINIHLTPIIFGGYSSELKKVIDRFIPIILPFFTKRDGETHHKHRYQERNSIIAIGFLDEADDEKESIFKELVYRNSLNMGARIHEALIYVKNQSQSDFIGKFTTILEKIEVAT